VRANFAAAEAEIDELHRATEDSVTATGTVDALTANFTKDVVLAEGVTIVVKAAGANTTSTPTLNVDATGVRTIVKDAGAALVPGDISGARHFCIFRYDLANTVWVLMNPSAASAWPIGSIYMNAGVATNPATLLGFGTWTAFGAGKVAVGFNAADTSFDVLEETGGSKDAVTVAHTHTATTASNGAHVHDLTTGKNDSGSYHQSGSYVAHVGISGSNNLSGKVVSNGAHTHTLTTESSGSSATNANLQPYITVNMWKRTA